MVVGDALAAPSGVAADGAPPRKQPLELGMLAHEVGGSMLPHTPGNSAAAVGRRKTQGMALGEGVATLWPPPVLMPRAALV